MFDPNKPFTVESPSSSEKGGFDPNAPFELYSPSRMERVGTALKEAYATAGKPNEGPYKFSDPLGGGEPYVPSEAELKAKPPVAKTRVAEPTPDIDAQVRRQLPKAPLVGPRANVPLPTARPVDVEYDIANKKSKYEANRPEAPQSPEGDLMTDTSGAIRTGGRNLDKLIGSQTGMLTAEESQADKAARVQGAQEKLQQTRDMALTIGEAERQHLRQYRDEDGVPFIDKLTQIEQLRKSAELRGDVQEFKAFDAAARALMARSDIGFRNELTQAKLGVSDTDIAKRQVAGDLDALIKAQTAPAATQTFARSAAETFPKAIADIAADTITGAQRIALSPVSLMEAVTGSKEAPISKILNRQGRELHDALSGGFSPDPAQAEDLGQKVVAGVASTAFFAGAGVVGRVIGMSPALATAVSGALPQAEQQWQEAERAAQRDPKLNQEWRKWVSFATGLGIGATEALPVGKLFERLERSSGGGFTRWLGAIVASSGEEGLQEGLQQLLQNANSIYLLQDPNVTLTKDVVDGMLVGTLSGALVTGGSLAAKGGLDAFRKIYPSREETPPELQEILYPANIGTAEPQARFGQSPYQQANVTVGQQQAPSVTPPTDVEAQGVVTPPSPAAPQITADEAGILKAAGYPISMVREMDRAFIDAELQDARANNIVPAALTQEEQAAILPQTVAPAPVQPIQASPGEQAQAALSSGVNPLEALFSIGSAQARPAVGPSVAPQIVLPPELTPPPLAPAVQQQEPQQIITPEVMGEAKRRLAARIETLINEGMPLNDATFQAINEVKEGTAPWIRGEQEAAPAVEAPVEQAVAEAPVDQTVQQSVVQPISNGSGGWDYIKFGTHQVEVQRDGIGWKTPSGQSTIFYAEGKGHVGRKGEARISQMDEFGVPKLIQPIFDDYAHGRISKQQVLDGLRGIEQNVNARLAAEEAPAVRPAEEVEQFPVLENVEGHRYLGINAGQFISMYSSPGTMVESAVPAKKFFSRTGQSAIQIRLDPADFTGEERAPAFVKEVIYNPSLLRFGNTIKSQEQGMANFNKYISLLKNAGVKVTENLEPARVRKQRNFKGTTPYSSMMGAGGIRAKSLLRYLPMKELEKLPRGAVNFKEDGSGQDFEQFANDLIQGGAYPEFYAQIQMSDESNQATTDMLETVIQDIRNNKWTVQEDSKVKKIDSVELQKLEEEAAKDAKADAENRKAIDFFAAKEGVEISPEVSARAIQLARDPSMPIKEAIGQAQIEEDRRLGLSEEDLQEILGDLYVKPSSSQEARAEYGKAGEQGARPEEKAGNEAAGEVSSSNVSRPAKRDEQLESIFNEMLDQKKKAPAASKPSQAVANFINENVIIDNPATSRGNTEWLQNKVDRAEASMRENNPRTSSGKGLVGATTAVADVNIPIKMLQGVTGASNENRAKGEAQYDELMEEVKKNGWNPTRISISINHLGQPYIYEGNTRVAVARELGIPTIPARVQWLNGAENVAGNWQLENFAKSMLAAPVEEKPAKLKGELTQEQIQAMIDAKLRPGYKVFMSYETETGEAGSRWMAAPDGMKFERISILNTKEEVEDWINGVLRITPEEAKPKTAAKPKPSQAEIDKAAEQAQASINEFFGLPKDNSIESQLEQQNLEDTVLDTVEPPPAFDPAPMPVAAAQEILKKENLQVTQNADGTFAVTGKGTFGWKDTIKALGGAWDKASKSWRLKNDPTQSLGSAIAAADKGGSSEGIGGADARPDRDISKAEELQRLRDREDGRGDERASDYTKLVGQGTKDLIANGVKFGVPQAVVDEQIEDVGMAVAAFNNGKPMFLLANEAGTGKTFVLGGVIRELSSKVPRIIYVTQSTDLIAQIKRDLAPYGIGNVEFVTYAKMDANANGAILIFDEAHNVKNIESNRGGAAAEMMKKAKMSIFASATPFQNPVEARYLGATGIFNGVGGFNNWAKMYGASVRFAPFYNRETGKNEKVEVIYWTGGASKREDGAAARQWFIKQGVMTQRSMKIDPEMIDVQFNRQEVSQEYVNLYNKVMEAYEAAIGEFTHEDGSPVDAKIFSEISRHRETMIKRILEASKAQAAIKRAKELLADGKNVVIFVETKADRAIGRFSKSEHFKNKTLYTYPEMASMMDEWAAEMGMARMMGEKGPARPFAAFIVEIARSMHSVGLDYELPSTADEIRDALGGKEKVAIYTGDVTTSAALKNKEAFLSGEKKVIIATMAKGGTGLSLHDTVGNRPTVQLNINLPWAAWQVDQVAARVGRYGLQSKALVEWMFASNIPWETTKLAPRVGARMADMGAIVKGIDIKAAGKLLGDFDFEGVMDVKQVLGEGVIGEAKEGDIYSEAERLEKARRLPADTSGGFFETPFPLAAFMTNVANIQPGTKVLEPSAGTGNLLRFLPNGAIAIAVEPRSDNVEALKKNMAGKSAHIVSTTFQEYEKDRMLRPVDAQPTFDTVLMNPPFERGPAGGWQDIGQVRAAYSMLAPNGRLISIMSEGPFFRQDGQSTEFRQFLDDVGATVVKMPEATFKKSGTLVNTRLVIIDKGAMGGRTDVDISKAPFNVATLRELQTNMPPRLEGAGASPAKNLSILPSRRIDQIDTNEAGNLINGALGIIQRVAGNFADVRLVNLLSSEDVSLEEARRSGFRGTEEQLTKAKGYAQQINSSLVGVTLATFYTDSLSATAYHEADHVLEVLNLYSPEEKRAREIAIPRLRNFLLGNGYNKESIAQMDDTEVRAYANELYSLYVDSGVKPDQIKIPDTMRRIYDKILRIVEGLRNWLSGNGYMNIEQVMESQYLGDIAKRAMADVASRMPMEEVSEAAKSYSFSEQTRNKIEALNAQTGAPVKAGRPSASFAAPAYGLADSISRKFSDRMGYQRQVQMAIEKFSGAPMMESLDAYLAADEMATRQSARLEKLRKQEIEPLINDIKKEGLTSDEVGEYLLAKHAQERNAYTLSIDAVFVRMQQIVRNPTISKDNKDKLRDQAMLIVDPVQQKMALAALKNVSTPTEKLRAQNRIDKMKIENRRSGITTPAAKIILDDFTKAGKTAALERIASKVYDMRDADLQRRIAGGLLDQDTVDGWNNRYSYYVNLSGFAELDGDEAPMGTGKGFSITKQESLAAKGRTTLSANPLINTIMAAENGIIRVEKNRVTNTLLRMIVANPNSELWTVNKVKMKKITGYDGLVKSVRDTDMQFGDNVVITKVGGVPYYIQLNNPRLAEEWKNLGSQVMTPLVKYAVDLTGFYSSLATSKNPAFAMTNVLRDLGEATFFTFTEDKKLGALFLKNFMPALVASVRVTAGKETPQQAGVYDAWNMSGGKISRESRKDIQQLAEEIEDILKGIDPLTLKNSPAKTLVLLKKSFKQLEKISEPLENATRMAVYMSAIEAGYSQKKAASFSREATANFGRRGIWSSYAGIFFLFFGANVAGTVGVMRRVATSKTARNAYLSLIPLGFLMTMLNLAISDDDPIEKWKKNYSHIPDYVRSDNIIFKYGSGEKDFVKFPLPFGLKAPYYAGEQAAMAMMGQISGSKAAGNTLANIVSAYSPLGHGGIIGAITPWFLLPAFELDANKKYFSGAPITPTEKQGVPRSEQYSTGTSQAAVMVARAINEISGGSSVRPGTFDIFPGHIQYITEKLTAGVGQFASDIVGVGKSVYQGTEMKPERTPFVKTFAPVVTSEAQRYYEAKKVYDEKVNRARAAKNQMERDMKNPELRKEVRQVLKEAGATWNFVKGDPLSWINSPIQYVQKADKAIAEINGKIKVVRESGLDARIKEQRIKVLTDKRDAEMSKARRRADPKLGAGAP